jgi:hypothetical protein
MAFSRSARGLCALGCLLITSVACTRVRPVGTTMPRVPASTPPPVAQAPQAHVQNEARSPTFGAVPRANSETSRVPAESSRVRQAGRSARRGQPYVPRLEYDVRVRASDTAAGSGTAARTEFPRIAIAEEVDRLQPSDFVVHYPAEMAANSPAIVTLAPNADLQQRLRGALGERGIAADELVTAIDATLSSREPDAFDIVPERNSGSERAWKVTPRQAGNRTLDVNITLTATLGGASHVKVFPPISHAVVVTSPAPQQFDNISGAPWFWPVAISVVIAAIALSMAFWRRSVA